MALSAAEGTQTVLFTDVEGSTDLGARRGDHSVRQVLRLHDEVVRESVARHDGREIKSLGDGLMVAFTSARRAVACAIDIQCALEGRRRLDPTVPIVRMGINAGEVIHEEGDIFGAAVTAAARISAKAAGGEILVSEVVKALVGTMPDVEFRDRGRFRLKGFDERWRLYELRWQTESVSPREFGRTPYVGRESERARLVSRLDAVLQGRGGIALIAGEPGVGKTRLAEEVLARARERDFRTLVGRCYEMDSPPPYLPFIEILEGALKDVDRETFRLALGDAGGEIAKVMPQLRALYDDLPPPLELPPEQERRYLFNSIGDFVERAATGRPLVILLDDLHWADESSLLLLQHIAHRLKELPVLLLGTYRDVELDMHRPLASALDALLRARLVERLPLSRMGVDGVRTLLARMAGRVPPGELVDAVHRETDGNPFFVEEVFRHLAEEGRLFDAAGDWRSDLKVGQLEVPESVRLVIGRRVDRLKDATRRALTAAAVVGRTFDFRLLEALGEVIDDDLLDAMDEAERAGLIREVDEREARFEFVHELIRQTLMSAISVPRRQRLHLKVADALERVHSVTLEDRAAAIVNHLYQAGASADAARIARFLLMAGDRAMQGAAFVEALHYYEETLPLIPEEDRAARADALFRKGSAQRSLGMEDALDTWRECIGILEELGDATQLAHVARNTVQQLGWAARWEEALEVAARGLALLGEARTAERASLLVTAGIGLAWSGQGEAAWQLIEEGTAIVDELDDDYMRGIVEIGKAVSYYGWGRLHEVIEGGIGGARRLGVEREPWNYATGMAFAMFAQVFTGDYEGAGAIAEELEPLANRLGYVGASLFVMRTKAFLADAHDFRLEEYGKYTERELELCEGSDLPWKSQSYTLRGQYFLARGEVDEALREMRRGAQLDPPGALWGWGLGFLLHGYACAGRIAEAEALRDEVETNLPEGVPSTIGRWSLLDYAIEAYELCGWHDRMKGWYELVRAGELESGVVFRYDRRLIQTLLGVAAAAVEDWEAAEEHFENALREAEDRPLDLERLDARRLYAGCLLRRNRPEDRARIVELCEYALSGYRAKGMPLFERMTIDILERAGARPASA